MSALEELRQLLDERGIEWEDYDEEEESVWIHTDVGRVAVWADTFDRQSCLNANFWDCVYSPSALVNLLFGKRSKAIITSNGITGTCRCESCGNTIDPWDRYCKHCGARLEVERWTSRCGQRTRD